MMELKSSKGRPNLWYLSTLNRTMMELKLDKMALTARRPGPLIVPWWNWNFLRLLLPQSFYPPLIVPWWNWNEEKRIVLSLWKPTLNRTMMELKFANIYILNHWHTPLIVPWWNWNASRRYFRLLLLCPLIVPWWNWNVLKSHTVD